MKYYLDKQYPSDKPMKALAEANKELEKRFLSVKTFSDLAVICENRGD